MTASLSDASVATASASNRALARFLLVAVGLGVALQVPALFNPSFLGLGMLVMWTPALGVLLAGAPARRLARRSLARPWPFKMMLLGAGLGWFHKAVHGLLSVAMGSAHFNAEHFALVGPWHVSRADFLWFFPEGGEALPLFLVHLVLAQLVGVVIVAPLLAFGEEVGWRGYLQPELERRWGPWKGTLAVAAIWAYWHLCFNLAGANGGEHPVLNAVVLFPLQILVVSFLYAWLVRSTGSVWPAICAHAANNSFPDAQLFKTVAWAGDKAASVLTTVLLAAVVLALLRFSRATAPAGAGVVS